MLTSTSNPIIKEIIKILNKKGQALGHKFVVEGVHLLFEALQTSNRFAVDHIVYATSFKKNKNAKDLFRLAKQRKQKTIEVSDRVYKKISELDNPEGILAVLKYENIDLDTLLKPKPKVCILGLELQDPGNLGTIFRTAEAFKVDCIFLSKGCVSPFNSKVIRASMGSILRLPFCKVLDVKSALARLRQQGFNLVGTAAHRGEILPSVNFKFPLVLILGSEAHGINEKLVDNITQFVKIPMTGKVESLNVAMAAGIMLYEVSKRR